MPRAREVEITKGDLKGKVLQESVKVWERNGWTVADDGSSEEQDSSTAPAAEPKKAPAKKTTTRKAD